MGDLVVVFGTGHVRVVLLGTGTAAPMVSRGKPKVGDLEVVPGTGHVAPLGTGPAAPKVSRGGDRNGTFVVVLGMTWGTRLHGPCVVP